MAKKDGFRALNVETLGPQIELPRQAQDKTRQAQDNRTGRKKGWTMCFLVCCWALDLHMHKYMHALLFLLYICMHYCIYALLYMHYCIKQGEYVLGWRYDCEVRQNRFCLHLSSPSNVEIIVLPRQTRDKRSENHSKMNTETLWAGHRPSLGARNGIFFWVFPMFVPSLSWQNDRFYLQMAQKCRLGKPLEYTAPIMSEHNLRITILL